jgi:uncharacterized OsmC-like protein
MFDSNDTAVINGINVRDVEALAGAVASDPARGATRWKVASKWQGGTHNRSTVKGFAIGGQFVAREFSLDVDEPLQLGGTNRFANPQEYLLAALNSCMMVGYVALCSLKGVKLESLEIDVEGDIDLRGFLGLSDKIAPGYEALNYEVRIKGDAAPEVFEEIHQTVMKTSPNFHNLSRAVMLNPTLKIEK